MRTGFDMKQLLDWCASVIGPCSPVASDERFHGRASVIKLKTPTGSCYLKIHRERATWDAEVHGYEQWAQAFGVRAPTLLGAHDAELLALLIAESPGRSMEDEAISEESCQQAWHDAGAALAKLHHLAVGESFGPCLRDGSTVGLPVSDAMEYVDSTLDRDIGDAVQAGYLSDRELGVVRAMRNMIPAFKGEQPVPCHRDYNPANWLIDENDQWIGVIDFEMSAWDVRVSEFSRYPQWEWMLHPERIDALFDGYGRTLTPVEQEQLAIAHAQYAVSCILWGQEHEYYGFVREAHGALAFLGKQV